MWAVLSRSTRRAMVCPGSSAAAIACTATSFPTLPFWTPFPEGAQNPAFDPGTTCPQGDVG
eukprot:1161353-Pelagomonas_calceolata.AAC.7